MNLASALGCSAALAALIVTLAPRPLSPATPATVATQDPVAAARGHLILIVQGNVQQLAITHAVAKTDPWGGAPKGLQSAFAVRLLGADDEELLTVPVDLSRFDTDPAHIGQKARVQGCEIRNSAIALSINVPRLATVRRYEFTRDGKPIGSTDAATVLRQIGEVR